MFWIAPGSIGSVSYAIAKFWLYGLPLVWLLLVDRRRPGLSPARRGGFGIGIILGIAIGAAILLVYHLYAEARIDTTEIRRLMTANGLDQPLRYIAACAYLALINSLLEEYAFRWFFFEKCRVLLPAIPAVIVAALIFTAHHVIVVAAYFDWQIAGLASFGVFIGGVIWSSLYLRFQSIWPGYVSHIFADCAIFIIGWGLIFPA